jgi:hypothetical protein
LSLQSSSSSIPGQDICAPLSMLLSPQARRPPWIYGSLLDICALSSSRTPKLELELEYKLVSLLASPCLMSYPGFKFFTFYLSNPTSYLISHPNTLPSSPPSPPTCCIAICCVVLSPAAPLWTVVFSYLTVPTLDGVFLSSSYF